MSAKITDPNFIIETLCDGPFALSWSGGLGTACFTITRPQPQALFAGGQSEDENIVVARVTMTTENWMSMRDLLNKMLPPDASEAALKSGRSMH